MARSKGRSEIEELRGENRSLRSENRQLKRTVSRLEKRKKHTEDLEDMIQEMAVQEPSEKPVMTGCLDCGGKLESVDLGVREIIKCSNCNKRVTRKK